MPELIRLVLCRGVVTATADTHDARLGRRFGW